MTLGARILGQLARLISRRPGLVVVVCLALAAVAATRVIKLEVTTSRTSLQQPDTAAEHEFGAFFREFGTPNDLIAVIDGGDVAELRKTADELAETLQKDQKNIRSTFHKVDLDYFLKRLLLFTPASELGQIKQLLSSSVVENLRASKTDGIDKILDEVTAAFEGRAASGVDPGRAEKGLEALAMIADELNERLRDPHRKGLIGFRKLVPPLAAGAIDDLGYLQSRDGRMRVMFIRSTQRSDENSVVVPLVADVRAQAASVVAEHPGLRIRIAGLPALQADEAGIVDRDVLMTTVASLAFITLILLYGYRRPQQVLLSLVPLAIGIAWTMAIVQLTYGKLNIVASAFMPILLGRGSDFAIYLIARFNAAREQGRSAEEAVYEALSSAGGGVVTGALVTAAAFFVATVGQFGAFSQLGVVVGLGLVLVLLASLLVTPALLILLGDRRLPGEVWAEKLCESLPDFGAGPGAISLRWPRVVLLASTVMTIAFAALARNVPFDFDLINLIPPNVEAVTAQRDLSTRSDYGTDVVVVSTDDVESARVAAARLEAMPNVGRVESIASFLPTDQPRKLLLISELRPQVANIPPFAAPEPPTTPQAVAAALERLGDAVDDKIFVTEQGKSPLAGPLKDLNAAVGRSLSTLRALPPDEAQRRVANVEDEIFGLLIKARALLRENVLDAKPVTLDDLPRATRERFVGQNGKSAVYVFPKKPGSGVELEAFVHDVRSAAPNATGFPIIYFDSSRSARHAFLRSSGQALVVIVVFLLLHFRRVSSASLALLPLVLAAITMAGLMRLLSVPHNMANVVSLPLLLGLGTDYGLQLVHHRRSVPGEPLRAVLQKTGLGVFMAGGTTAAGFGALAMAEHKGAQSLGLVLFLGTSSALLCSLVVLPAILQLIDEHKAKRDGAAKEKAAPADSPQRRDADQT